MDANSILTMLKYDLGIKNNARDEYFTKLIESAQKEIEGKGITLRADDVDDMMLIADMAAWRYRKRMEDIPLPRNLLNRIRNRKVKEMSNHESGGIL